MNNYSYLQQLLHRSTLSSRLIRELTFDIEQYIFLTENDRCFDNHIFITGLARSGTTILLNSLHSSNEFASNVYEDMPFILATNLWSKINRKGRSLGLRERSHGDNILISSSSPEAFEEVFWLTFENSSYNIEKLFKAFVALLLKQKKKVRYLSKNNQNLMRLNLLSSVFPDSIIFSPFREPLQQALSLYNQHLKFIKKGKKDPFIKNYMKWIGHKEFGPGYNVLSTSNLQFPDPYNFNHWLEQWFLCYRGLLECSLNNDCHYLVQYELLCGNPKIWTEIKKISQISQNCHFDFRESKNHINLPYDRGLSKKCYKLYEEMSRNSLGFE